jgi:predicted NBD/HSP70 family sugar kinase
MDDQPSILGLDIGGTKTAVVRGDRSGRIHDRIEFATRTERGFDATFDELCVSVRPDGRCQRSDQVATQPARLG